MGETDVRSTDKGFEIERGRKGTNKASSNCANRYKATFCCNPGNKNSYHTSDEAKNTVESSGFANQVVGEIKLQQEGDDVVFRMNTIHNKRMFGFLPVQVNSAVDVSATTGQITNTTQSLGQRLLDLFSF